MSEYLDGTEDTYKPVLGIKVRLYYLLKGTQALLNLFHVENVLKTKKNNNIK